MVATLRMPEDVVLVSDWKARCELPKRYVGIWRCRPNGYIKILENISISEKSCAKVYLQQMWHDVIR